MRLHKKKRVFLIIIPLIIILFIVVVNHSIDLESEFNICLKAVCDGETCVRHPRNGINVELFGKFDEVLLENNWICQYLPIKLHDAPSASSNEFEEVYVSELLEHEDTGVTCEFVVTTYGFFFRKFEVILDCSDDPNHEFLGPGLY